MKARRIVVVGIPGVGKTTVVDRVIEALRSRGIPSERVVFGTIMFEEAKRLGVEHRDVMRKLPLEEQRRLQMMAASKIAEMEVNVLFVDTHLMISTKEGYWPGLPFDVLRTLSPSNLMLVEALPSEIITRRMKDSDRYRDKLGEEEIANELATARSLLSASAIIAGAPMLIVMNKENHIEEAVSTVLSALEVV